MIPWQRPRNHLENMGNRFCWAVGWAVVAHVGPGRHVCICTSWERTSWGVYDDRTHTNAPDYQSRISKGDSRNTWGFSSIVCVQKTGRGWLYATKPQLAHGTVLHFCNVQYSVQEVSDCPKTTQFLSCHLFWQDLSIDASFVQSTFPSLWSEPERLFSNQEKKLSSHFRK